MPARAQNRRKDNQSSGAMSMGGSGASASSRVSSTKSSSSSLRGVAKTASSPRYDLGMILL